MKTGNKNFMIFHAVTSYPTPYDLANLNVIKTMLERYPDIVIGYSDHTIGWQCSYAARVMGAMVIERHFTLDPHAEGPDHVLSSTPEEMKILVDAIRIFEQAQGDGIKMPTGHEVVNRKNNAKSIVLDKGIKKGEVLTQSHLSIKRPGYGIEPKRIDEIVGRKVHRDLDKDDILLWEDLG
jgi:N-acetylneuraminate synthase